MWQLHSDYPATYCCHLLGAYPKLLVLLLRQGSQVELDAHMLAQHHLQEGQLIAYSLAPASRHRQLSVWPPACLALCSSFASPLAQTNGQLPRCLPSMLAALSPTKGHSLQLTVQHPGLAQV